MRYWLGLGANLGDRAAAIQAAVDALADRGLVIEAVSRLWETAPREVLDQPAFLNAACRAATELAPPAVLDVAKEVERELGRRPGRRYGPRAIDCDLLLWEGGEWSDERLAIPHPRLAERRFALLPLLDVDPALALPDGRGLAALAAALDPDEQPAHPLRRTLAAPGYNDRPVPPPRTAP
jgi:2-amino-4-hydroxy-6-hydroxymethyldihydropteridine diphosphokinase